MAAGAEREEKEFEIQVERRRAGQDLKRSQKNKKQRKGLGRRCGSERSVGYHTPQWGSLGIEHLERESSRHSPLLLGDARCGLRGGRGLAKLIRTLRNGREDDKRNAFLVQKSVGKKGVLTTFNQMGR